MKRLLYILFLSLTAAMASAQVKVEARLDVPKILIGEPLHWNVVVTAPKHSKVSYALFADSTHVPNNVELMEQHIDTTDVKGENVITFSHTLTAWEARNYELPAQTVSVDGKTYTTNRLAFDVKAVDVDTTATALARPADDVQKLPFDLNEWLPYFWLSVTVVGLLVLAFFIYLRLKSKRLLVRPRKNQHPLLPHEKALQAINKVKAENNEGVDDQKAYYTALTDILRQYLADRFGINAMEMTSSEIVDRLRSERDQAKLLELEHVFRTADLVKFAKYSTPDDERTYSLTNVVAYIEETKTTYVPQVEDEAEAIAEAERRSKRIKRWLRLAMIMVVVVAMALLVYVVRGVMMLIG